MPQTHAFSYAVTWLEGALAPAFSVIDTTKFQEVYAFIKNMHSLPAGGHVAR
jgi:hypothetical protein